MLDFFFSPLFLSFFFFQSCEHGLPVEPNDAAFMRLLSSTSVVRHASFCVCMFAPWGAKSPLLLCYLGYSTGSLRSCPAHVALLGPLNGVFFVPPCSYLFFSLSLSLSLFAFKHTFPTPHSSPIKTHVVKTVFFLFLTQTRTPQTI